MLDIYAQTFMTATRNRPCIKVTLPRRKWWHGKRTRCVDLQKL